MGVFGYIFPLLWLILWGAIIGVGAVAGVYFATPVLIVISLASFLVKYWWREGAGAVIWGIVLVAANAAMWLTHIAVSFSATQHGNSLGQVVHSFIFR